MNQLKLVISSMTKPKFTEEVNALPFIHTNFVVTGRMANQCNFEMIIQIH